MITLKNCTKFIKPIDITDIIPLKIYKHNEEI